LALVQLDVYISNSIVSVYFHSFVCADAFLDDETIEEDGSGATA
jgi:hypothetical protein